MEYRQLGRTDLQVSSIGLGGVTFGREVDVQNSFSILDHALERGINLLDTAEAYAAGRSEEVVGRWLSRDGNRERVVLTTKVAPPLRRDRILQAADDSLRRLRTNVIDLYLLHAFDANTPLDETLEALNSLVEQGKVRYIGCSNFAAWQICKALWKANVNGWARLEAVQPNYNLAIRDIEAELLPFGADQEIGVITYSPLAAGFLTGKYSKSWTAPKGTRFDIIPDHWEIYENDTSMRRMEGLRAISEETAISMVQLALAWVIGQPGVTSVLIGCRSTSHVDQALEAEKMGLAMELRERLSALD